MRIPDYPRTTTLDQSNLFLLDGDNGTQSIQSKDLANSLLSTLTTQELLGHVDISSLEELYQSEDKYNQQIIFGTPDGYRRLKANYMIYASINDLSGSDISTVMRNNTYRGLNLGSYVTNEQYDAISAGTFDDMFVGDYWMDNSNNKWRIAGFNYWFNTGNAPVNTHHIVIVPDQCIGEYNAWHTSTNLGGGYLSSNIHQHINQVIVPDILTPMFGDGHLYNHKELLTNGLSSSAWVTEIADLITQPMLYGSYISGIHSRNTMETIDAVQLPLFRLNPLMINNRRQDYWLRDIVTENRVALHTSGNVVDDVDPTYTRGVRPVFGIIG